MPAALPPSAFVGITPTSLGTSLQQIMDSDDIRPGDEVSYELCKAIWLYHPLGNKMAESPIRLAQSQDREISVPGAPEGDVVEAFQKAWEEIDADRNIMNVGTQARVYGLASLGIGIEGQDSSEPINFKDLYERKPFFNVLDPLNTSGLIVDQNPNSPTFQKHRDLVVNGVRWHRSRTVTHQNEEPVYIAWTTSAFAYSGRSVFQRALYPLRSYLNSMVIDDMVLRKAGLLVLKLESSSSVVDRIMQGLAGLKRALLRQGQTDNVMSMGVNESAESLNLNNIDGAVNMSRSNVIKNTATAADMPAKMLTEESYVEGFGEGTEDARRVAQWIDRVRIELAPLYSFMDVAAQYRAWNPDFYKTIQSKYEDTYGDVPYEEAFYRWRNSFRATWPNLIKEPESALVAVDDVKLKAALATVQILIPLLANIPEAMGELLNWFQIQLNTSEHLFAGGKLLLDPQMIVEALEEDKANQEDMARTEQLMQQERDRPAPAFSGRDSVGRAIRMDADRRNVWISNWMRSTDSHGRVANLADAMTNRRVARS